jgi:hypothetical protein
VRAGKGFRYLTSRGRRIHRFESAPVGDANDAVAAFEEGLVAPISLPRLVAHLTTGI